MNEHRREYAVTLMCRVLRVTNEFYLTGDADGIVSVLKDEMQQHFPVG